MDNYINNLMKIEEKANDIVKLTKEKKENIDELVENELNKQKDKIDVMYVSKLRFKQKETEEKLKLEQEKVEKNLNEELEKLKKQNEDKKQEKIEEVLKNIFKY